MDDDDDDDGEVASRQISVLFRNAAGDLFFEALMATSGDRGAADDLVQEVFHAAWKAWAKIGKRDLSGQRAWLYATLKNKVVDAYRRGRREIAATGPELEALRRQDRRPAGATHRALSGAVLDQCWEVIKRMPPVRRKVFLLKAQEWKTAEIAEHLRITQSTVRDHIRDGLRQLNMIVGPGRVVLDDLEEDEFEDEAE